MCQHGPIDPMAEHEREGVSLGFLSSQHIQKITLQTYFPRSPLPSSIYFRQAPSNLYQRNRE